MLKTPILPVKGGFFSGRIAHLTLKKGHLQVQENPSNERQIHQSVPTTTAMDDPTQGKEKIKKIGMGKKAAKLLLMVAVGLGISCSLAIAQTKISVWWTTRDPVVKYLDRELTFFEKAHPDIKIVHSILAIEATVGAAKLAKAERAMAEELLPMIASGTGPDLAYIDESFLSPLLNAEALRAIPADIYDREKVEETFGKAIADLFSVKGKYYMLPYGNMTSVIFYNPEILKKYGYAGSDIPKTWDGFLSMAQKMTDLGKGQPGFAINGNHFPGIVDAVLYQKGGYFYRDNEEVMLDTQALREALKFNRDLYDKYKIDTRSGVSAMEAFGSGKTPLMFSWSWFIGYMDRIYPEIPYNTSVLPTFTGKPPYGRFGYNLGFAVTAIDPVKIMAAWEFYKFLMSPDFQYGFAIARGCIPTQLKLREKAKFRSDPFKSVIYALQPGNTINTGGFDFSSLEVTDIISAMSDAVVLGGKPTGEAITAAQKETTEAMKRFRDPWNLLWGKEGWEKRMIGRAVS